ncbi:MAG: hypothetical protein AAF617_02640 [Bacteroidota bacterium]
MKTKRSILLLIFTTFSFVAFAQIDMKAEEEKLIETLKMLRTPDSETDMGKVAAQFETELTTLLRKKESWSYRFPELRKYIDIKRSSDRKIRTFSWDSRLGGSWHTLETRIQHETANGLQVFSLQNKKLVDDEEQEGNEVYRDAIIIDIHSFANGYVFEGFGTHGSGHHHKVLMYYELSGDTLVRKEIFENNESIYVLLIPRRYDFDLSFDFEAQTITHSEFKMDDEIGFYMPTGKKVLLTFDGKKFKKQLKKI